MTRPGWVQCPHCSGSGWVGPELSGDPRDVPGIALTACPDCAGGEVPGEELVDAAGAAWGDVVYDGTTPAWWLETRAALIAARRWEEQ